MPWSVISSGVTEEYLWRELQRAKGGVTTRTAAPTATPAGLITWWGGLAMSKLRLFLSRKARRLTSLTWIYCARCSAPSPTELDIKHSNGYHPHPIISIVLPLPVGQSSQCSCWILR